LPTVEQSIDVNVDVTMAYDQWSPVESFPRWMEGVASVDQTSDSHLHWVAKVRNEFRHGQGTRTVSGTPGSPSTPATSASPGRASAGKPDEKPNAGAATFESLGASSCRVTFRMEWEPEDALETPSEVLAAVNQVVAADSRALQGPHRSGTMSRPALAPACYTIRSGDEVGNRCSTNRRLETCLAGSPDDNPHPTREVVTFTAQRQQMQQAAK